MEIFGQEQLKIISNCPVCSHRHLPEQIQLLTERANSHLLYIQCQKCQSRVVVFVSTNQSGISTLGFITDLNQEEVMEFSRKKAISSDEVLEWYQGLKKKSVLELL